MRTTRWTPSGGLTPGQRLTVRARREDGAEREFEVIVRIDGPMEVEYYRHGGILPMVLCGLITGEQTSVQ